jgi:peptide subunit release factor 1 (eRF1)
MTTLSRQVLSRAKMLDFLSELEKIPCHGFRTLYLPLGVSSAEVENSIKEMPEKPDIVPQLVELVVSSKTGSVLFLSPERRYLVLPPFPILEKHLSHTLATEQLLSLLRHEYTIALVLVRLGAYAIGVCDGENLVSSKVGTGLVHGRHKKGGSSQQRFARHRDKQIEYFLSRVCRHAREHLEPYQKVLDYVIYGGARTTIQLLQKQCAFVAQLDKPVLPPLLDIPEPRQAVLETAISRVWSSTVLEWQEED